MIRQAQVLCHFHLIPGYTHAIWAAWSSTILTMSLVIPAVIQKKQGALTLYHATLVLNFATLSSISSLAMVHNVPYAVKSVYLT
jgi:hypothetical protein